MICSGCGAPLIDGTQKCPFCRELLVPNQNNTANSVNGDVTYKIESKKQIELIKKSTISGVSREKRLERKRRKRRQKIKAYAILSLIAAVLVAVIIGLIALVVNLFSDDKVYTTVFYSDNTLSVSYEGEAIVLSENAVNLKTVKEGERLSDIISSLGLVKVSASGNTTCFIDNYDINKNQGTLKVMIEDDYENIITVSDKVSSGLVLSDDGEHILFIKNANTKGNRGELWYLSQGDEAVKIAEKVDVGRFILTCDGENAVYIKNYNYTSKSGEIYMANLDDLTEEKLDKDVYAVYTSSKDSETIIYSKNYNDETKCFDIHMRNSEESVCAVMGATSPPVLSEEGKYAFACGDKNNNRYNLYRLNLNKLEKEKIISNMSGVIKISPDGGKVAYSKLFENNVGDYYIWTEGETEIKVADGVNYTKSNQIAISDDFEKIAYIANYDENKNGGILYTCEYSEDSVTDAEKISEDVYNCYVLKNCNIVYNKNYSSKGKTAQLYLYNGVQQEINSEINPMFVTIDGNYIICLYDYNENDGGSLYVIDEDLEETKLTTDVSEFYLKGNGAILAKRNKDKKSGEFDLYETDEDKENITLITKDADGILKY